MVLGRGQDIGRQGGDEEKVTTLGPPWAGPPWVGDVQFMVLLPAMCSPLFVPMERVPLEGIIFSNLCNVGERAISMKREMGKERGRKGSRDRDRD